jgi:succinoglycan biosynthesis protein ExoA
MTQSEPPISNPRISVVLPCRNEVHHIRQCLESVLGQQDPEGGFEIIVADGLSDDGTPALLAEIARRHPRVRVIQNPLRIVSSGLNAAIRASRGAIIIRMDAHTEYAPDYIRQCTEVLARSGADNVGGPWVARGRDRVSSAIAAGFQSPFSAGNARGHNPNFEGDVDTVYLGCWHRTVFEKYGFFDEELVRNQDDEHNLRITRSGGRVYQSPSIRSWYTPRNSISALYRQYRQYGYWKVRVIRKHRLPASFRHLVPGLFVVAFGASLIGSLIGLVGLFAGWQSSDGPVSPWSLACWFTFAGLSLAYGSGLLCASVITSMKAGGHLIGLLPIVFPAFHFGYGVGFLRGIWDFVVLRRGAGATFSTLTRGSVGTGVK